MISANPSSKSTGHLLFAAIALAASWWLPNHHWPWADFYSDAWASLVLGAVAAGVLWKYRKSMSVQEWHALPMLTLACCGVVGTQFFAGLIEAPGVAWTSILYLVALTVALLIGSAWERAKPSQCADFLFLAVLLGASGSLLVQLQQWLRLDVGDAFWLFLPAPARRFHGNLGQPNQLATLMCLGVLACAWFHERKLIPGTAAWVVAALLALGLALTESRTSWVIALCSMVALFVWRKRLSISWQLSLAAVCWVAFFALCVFSLPHINVWLGRTLDPQEVRGLLGREMRLDIWAGVWDALMQRPWLGFGWMQTSLTQFPTDPYNVATDGSLRHAHNLVLDLLVYMGIPLGLAVCTVLLAWVWAAVRRLQHRKHLWMFLFAAALGIHAMFEFPLYYAYFLLPLGLMLGALTAGLQFRAHLTTTRWPVCFMLGAATIGCFITIRDYLPIENDFFSLRFEHQKLASPDERSLPSPVVLTHLQDLLWLGRVDPVKAHNEADVQRAVRASKLTPSLIGQYKLAVMYALAEQPHSAEYWLIVMLRTNGVKPAAAKELQLQWERLAIEHPSMAQVAWPR